jgi:sugar lactone lactonase YvrE
MSPAAIAVDSSGNVYVAISFSGSVFGDVPVENLIEKITPTGTVSTLAGAGPFGSANGTGTSASFNWPYGVAVDSSGNVYVGDALNNLIREISPAGVVTTFAGSGSKGAANGTGVAASFNNPNGVAVDSSGNVYVADSFNSLIRKITSGGVVTTLAGSGSIGSTNGTGTAASFNAPTGVAVDSSGNVYVAEIGNNLIREISPAGVVTTLAGSGSQGAANGTGTAASFNRPFGVAVDASGNVYVADSLNNLIRKITPGGVVTTLAGSGSQGSDNGTGTAASFNLPQGVAVDSSGNVYVADSLNNLVRKVTPGGVVTTFATP